MKLILKKIGNSLGFLIPSYFIKKFNLKENKEYNIIVEEIKDD